MQVLRLVWQHQPCTERQISDLVQQQRSVARTTVSRPCSAWRPRGCSPACPTKAPSAFAPCRMKNTLSRPWWAGSWSGSWAARPGPLLAYFADSGKLSEKDLKTLRAIAQKIAQTAGARIGRCCDAHHVADGRRLGGRLAEGDGGLPLAVGALGGAGGSRRMVPAAVLARGPLLAVADRRHQAAADALLVAGRSGALVAPENSAEPIRQHPQPPEISAAREIPDDSEPDGASASISGAAGERSRSLPHKAPHGGISGDDFLGGMAHGSVAGGDCLATPPIAPAAPVAGPIAAAVRSPPTASLPNWSPNWRQHRASPPAGRCVRRRGLPAVCLRAVATAARIAQSADVVAWSRRASASHLARAGAREAAGLGLGMDGGDRADGLLLPSAGLVGRLSAAAGAGTGLRPTGDGPQRASARLITPRRWCRWSATHPSRRACRRQPFPPS